MGDKLSQRFGAQSGPTVDKWDKNRQELLGRALARLESGKQFVGAMVNVFEICSIGGRGTGGSVVVVM